MNVLEKITADIAKSSLPEMPVEKLKKLKEHYAKVLNKYGYDFNAKGSEKLPEYFAKYYAAKEYSEFKPLVKSLFLIGNPGTGKTYAMDIFMGLFNLEKIQASDFANLYAEQGEAALADMVADYRWKEIIIDDLGAERETKSYGNGGILIEVLTKRCNLWADSGIKTHFTSNFSTKILAERYGERLTSRFAGSCVLIALDGQDRRKNQN